MRVLFRRFNRTSEGRLDFPATHRIKVGIDGRKDGGARPVPRRLPGFLICRDTRDGNNLVVDFEAMARLGYSPEQIAQARAGGLQAEGDLLPRQLDVLLAHDAVLTDRGWTYPGTFGDAYQCWRSEGLWCQGDGEWADRQGANGTRERVACNPVGAEGRTPPDFCPESASRECALRMALCVILYTVGDDGKPAPLSPDLGESARYRLDTSSEIAAMRITSELDLAAALLAYQRPQGGMAAWLTGLRGVLTFAVVKRRTGKAGQKDAKGKPLPSVVPAPAIGFTLNEADIRERLAELRRRAADHGLPAPTIEAPRLEAPAAVERPAIDVPPDPADDADLAEPGGDPDGDPQAVETVTVADLSDATLVKALDAHVAAKRVEYPVIAWFNFTPTGRTAQTTQRVVNGQWFFAGGNSDRDAYRRARLREICARLEADEGSGFAALLQTLGQEVTE